MRRILLAIFSFFLVLPSLGTAVEKGLTVKGVRYFSYPTFTRIVLEIEAAAPYTVNRSADGRSVLLAAYEGPLVCKTPLPAVRDNLVGGIETREDAGRQVIVVRLDPSVKDVKDFVLRGPDRIVLDISRQGQTPGTAPASPAPDKQVVVVLDPGHGGKDTGIVTVQGQEKAIALELAQTVKRLLQQDARFKIVLTRDRDTTMTLDERSAAANTAKAQVFLSIHIAPAGSAPRVYIQDPDEDLHGQAQRPVTRDFLGFESGSDEQENRWGRQQAAHARQSGALGRVLARQLQGNSSAEPVQAPLAVLKPVAAAAVLIETAADHDRTAAVEAIARGIESYAREN